VTKERVIRLVVLALILWSSPFIIDSMVYSARHYSLPEPEKAPENVAPAPSEAPPAPEQQAPEPVEPRGQAPPPTPEEH
jgi:hypothetical protein